MVLTTMKEVRKLFIGEYRHGLDAKGRVIVPVKFRDGLGDKFVLTKGLDGCLFAYSKEEWANFENKIKTLPLTSKDARAFVRFFFSGAVECEIDKQGRTLIPPMLTAAVKPLSVKYSSATAYEKTLKLPPNCRSIWSATTPRSISFLMKNFPACAPIMLITI